MHSEAALRLPTLAEADNLCSLGEVWGEASSLRGCPAGDGGEEDEDTGEEEEVRLEASAAGV